MRTITDKEIEFATKILLEEGQHFYDDDKIEQKEGERIEVIKCLENRNIVASPGSGKTTTLLAKLIIFANHMPSDDGRGICVLTHTNVAIDLIKEKLGHKSYILFSYPNFFGTIQSFVNKYLAIPCFINSNGFRPVIDNGIYYEIIKKEYQRCTYLPKKWIEGQVSSLPNKEEYQFIGNLRFKFYNPSVISKSLFGNAFAEESKPHYKKIKSFKKYICKCGYIPFEEAYTIAFSYINKYPKIIEALRQRFKFVFIDEMQDTTFHQSKIIDTLFRKNDDVVLQCYGDPNQAIYDNISQYGDWNPTENILPISESKRFGPTIANNINTIRRYYDDQNPILGNSLVDSLPPHLILFSGIEDAPKVLYKFSELIVSYGLHNNISNHKFKAVGKVGTERDDNKLTIKTYFPEFEKKSKTDKEYFSNLISYIHKQKKNEKGVRIYAKSIINALLNLLDREDIRYEKEVKDKEGNTKIIKRRFSKTSLFYFLKTKDECYYFQLKENIANWSKMIFCSSDCYNQEVKQSIQKYIIEVLIPIWKKPIDDKNSFFTDTPEISLQAIEKDNIYNEYEYKDEKGQTITLNIHINTVHGEKGETHTATLYLETFFKKYDSEYIIQQFKGNPYLGNGVELPKALKLAYVGMSRPTHLLCVAVQYDYVKDHLDDLDINKNGNWKIINMTS